MAEQHPHQGLRTRFRRFRRPPRHRDGEIARGVRIEVGGAKLPGELRIPPGPKGLAIFASSRDLGRMDPRQAHLARALFAEGFGTLVFDLVEGRDAKERRESVELLSGRLVVATEWSARQPGAGGLPLAYVGSGLGAAAAVCAAAALGYEVSALALHDGRPELAGPSRLARVRAPTLLVVCEGDLALLEANQQAAMQLRCPYQLKTVPEDVPASGAWHATPAIVRWLGWHTEEAPAGFSSAAG